MSYCGIITSLKTLEQRTIEPSRHRHLRDRRVAELVKGWTAPGPYLVTRTAWGKVESSIREG